MNRLALGTVQFGLSYGVTNTEGQVSEANVGQILQEASLHGIDMLDTAAAYGESEIVLSKQPDTKQFELISKTLPLSGMKSGLEQVEQALNQSLGRLALHRPLYGMLIHHADDLLGPQGDDIWKLLQEKKQQGRICKIGVSVYSAQEIDLICQRYAIDLVQLPHNVLDQRLRISGHLQTLQDNAIEIHVRSAFLQGLLLLSDTADLPVHLQELKPALTRFQQRAKDLSCSMLTLALGYLRQQTAIDRVLVGVVNPQQLTEIIAAWTEAASLPLRCADDLAIDTEHLLNPAKWSLLKASQ